jgi:hypothetical protein
VIVFTERKAINGRSDRKVVPTPCGVNRELVNSYAYKHGKTRRYGDISIPVPKGIFNMILPQRV